MITTILMSQAWLHSLVLPFVLSLWLCFCSGVNQALGFLILVIGVESEERGVNWPLTFGKDKDLFTVFNLIWNKSILGGGRKMQEIAIVVIPLTKPFPDNLHQTKTK